jgi:hypothetical protein
MIQPNRLPSVALLVLLLLALDRAEAQGPFAQGIAQLGNGAAAPGLGEKPQGLQLGMAMIQQALAPPPVAAPPVAALPPVAAAPAVRPRPGGVPQGLLALAQQGLAQGAAVVEQGLAQRPQQPGALVGGPPKGKPGKGGPPFGKGGPPFGKAKGKGK